MDDADNPMPYVCDRCGTPVEPNHHLHFDFQTWQNGANRTDVPAGRLCPSCGDHVSDMLIHFGRALGLTTVGYGHPRFDGHMQSFYEEFIQGRYR